MILISTDHFIRWWDFGADAYIVRSSIFLVNPILIVSARIRTQTNTSV